MAGRAVTNDCDSRATNGPKKDDQYYLASLSGAVRRACEHLPSYRNRGLLPTLRSGSVISLKGSRGRGKRLS